MKKLLILLCLMFPLMAQSVNDSKEAKEEMRKERLEQHQMMQNKMWKQQDHNRKAEIDKMIMKMKMHDRKMYQEHMKRHHIKTFTINGIKIITMIKKTWIIGGIVIFSLGYIVRLLWPEGKTPQKDKNFKGDR